MWKAEAVALAVVYGSLLLATTSQWDIVKSLCEDMRPPGDDKPRTDPSPYTIKVDWTINSAVIITVYGFYCLGHTFRGVMIQVRANSTPIGTFSRFSRKLIFLNCPPGIRNMAYNVSRTKQLFIATIWRPPAEFLIMDNVRIHATVIKEKGIYWHISRTIPPVMGSTTTEFINSGYLYAHDLGRDYPTIIDSKHIKSDYYY